MSEVQHIAEVGIGIEQAMQDLNKLEKLVRDKSITLGQLLKADFKIDNLFEQFDQPVPRLFSDIAKEATLMEEKIGMSVASARKQMQSMGHLGGDIIKYFKRDGQKSAVEWTQAFESEFGKTDFRKLLSPYIKWTEDGGGISPDELTGELSEKFPQLSKDVFNYTELWERLAEQVRNYRAEIKQLAETGANTYFEQIQQSASGASDVFDRIIEQQERLYSAGGFTEVIGKSLLSVEDIQAMVANLESVANIQSKISVTTDESGKAVKVNIDYIGELNEKWQETYKWVSQADEETGAVTEGFKRVSSVATESADAAKKLADEFNKIQIATEKMNLSSIQIFEQGGETGMADRLRSINAQMGEIKQSADSITRSDVERIKQLQRQSELIAIAAKEEKQRQQAAASAAKEERQNAAAIVKEQKEIAAQYSKVAAIQKDINRYSLDTSGYAAQLSNIKEQSTALFEKLRTNQQITDEERKQLENNQQLLTQIQAQVSAQKSASVGVLSPGEKSLGDIAKSIGIYGGGYMIFRELKKAMSETVETMRDVETGMMEIARVMELSSAQSDRFRDSLFGAANEMARTFEETSQISLRFAQAGFHDMAENAEMTRVALLAMNTAELDAVNSTNSLIGILNQWNLGASDLVTVIDKLNYTADTNAITTQDLVDALLRSSGAAKNAKISFDELVGVNVALREATGRTGKELGTAVNSIIAFTTRAKSLDVFESMGVKVWLDEQKTALNSVMDIWRQLSDLYKTSGESMVNVLSRQTDMTELFSQEVAQATDTLDEYNQMIETQNKLQGELTDAERKTLTEQFGVYRRNYVIALLEDFDKIGEVVGDMDKAMGHSARENARYMETLDAKVNQLVTSLQELAVQAGEAGLLDLAKGAVQALTAITGLTKGVGGIVPVLLSLAAVIAVIKRESIATGITSLIGTFDKAQKSIMEIVIQADLASKGMGTFALSAGATTAALLGVVGVITVITFAINAYNQAQEEARIKAIEAAEAFETQQKSIENLNKEINNETLTRDELISLMTSHNQKYGEELSAIGDVNEARQKAIDLLDEEAKARARETIRETGSQYQKQKAFLESMYAPIKDIPIYGTPEETLVQLGEALDRYHAKIEKGIELNAIEKSALKTLEKAYSDTKEKIEDARIVVEGYEAAQSILNGTYERQAGAIEESDSAVGTVVKSYEELAEELNNTISAMSDIENSIKTLSSANDELSTSGEMTAATFQKMIDNDLLQYLELTENGIWFNIEALDTEYEALKDNAIAKATAAANAQILAAAEKYVAAESANATNFIDNVGNAAQTAGEKAATAASGVIAFADALTMLEGVSTANKQQFREEYDKIVDDLNKQIGAIKSLSLSAGGGGRAGSTAATKAETEAIKGQADAINDEIKALQEREKVLQDYHKNEIKRLQDEAKATQESYKKREEAVKKRYDAEIKELRALQTEYDREDARADYLKSRAELEAERAEEEKKTGRESVERIKEIDKALADLDEKERRRQRDVSIDKEIADIEEKRDRKIKAIQDEAAEQQAKYDEQIESINELMELEKLYFEEQISNFKEILELIQQGEKSEAYKKAYDAQKKELESLKGKTDTDTKAMSTFIEQMYAKATANSASYAKSAISDANQIVAAYQRIIDTMDRVEERAASLKVSSSSSSRSSSSSSSKTYVDSGGAKYIPSSHTGSLTLSEGLVNIAPAELIVRPDISAGLLETIDLVKRINAQTNYNSYDNSNNYNNPSSSGNTYYIDVHLDNAVFPTGTTPTSATRDINREITTMLNKLP